MLAFLLPPGLLALALQDPSRPARSPSPPPADLQSSDDAGSDPQVLPLRVEDVVRMVGRNAPTLIQSVLAAASASGSITEAEGAFDPVLFSDLTYSYAESPTAGGFLSAGVTATHARGWRATQGLRSALLSGASVSLSLSEQYNQDNQPSFFFGLNPRSTVNLDFNFTQPLLKGGWSKTATYGIRSAEIAADRARSGVRQAAVDAVQAAVDAYWDLAFAIEDVKVKELSLRLAEELRDVTQAKYEVGSAAEVEVVQTEADIANRTDALLTARNTVRQAEDRLRTLLFPLEDPSQWDWKLSPISELPSPQHTDLRWQDAFAVADRERADLRQLRSDVAQKRLDWEVAQRNLLPKLDLVATGNSAGLAAQVGDALTRTRGFYHHGYSLGLSFELPFGNRAGRGEVQRTELAWRLAERQLRDQRNQVAVAVRDAVRSVDYLADRVTATSQASKVAKRQLEAEQRRLREGTSTNFRVLQFQRDLEQALTAEKSARMAYAKAVIKLNTVQGLDWDGSLPPSEEGAAAEQPQGG